jgi:outer membrane protein OmpA-like peptidoglycan-associated protein
MKLQLSIKSMWVIAACCFLITGAAGQSTEVPASAVTRRNIKAIGYPVNGGSTSVDLVNSGSIRSMAGKAKVVAKPGVTQVEVQIEDMRPPSQLGAEFLTYVLWAVSPDGRAVNLGEVVFNANGKGQLKATTQLPTFSLFVTAEPYFAVRQPSEMLILENALRENTKGRIFVVENYALMKRSQYQKLGNPLALIPDTKNVPLEMYEARNSVDIAGARGAENYAPDIFSKAQGGLSLAENALARKAERKEVISLARQATQSAEDARALTVERLESERIANEKAEAAAKAKAEAEARAAAEAAEAKRKADAEAARQAEIAAAREAQARAEAAAREAKLEAEAAIAASKAKAEADALKAKNDAAIAEAQRAKQAAEQLRAQLLEQFNRILETRDSERGLVITMADVLFDTGKFDLRPGTRETLAKLSGIILGHPGLNLDIEGHTDSTGSDELNQKLSEQRAETARTYLVSQGIEDYTIVARGFGKTMPVADNDTREGRQKNRRVEIIVSGEVIGVKIGK